MADHSRPRHRSKCPGCTRLMRGGNHLNKCRSCHGCTIDNKCDTCSKWTDVVCAGIVERSQARLNRKRRAVSETQAYDKPSTKLKPALREERSHKDKQARLETCSISSGSFLGFSPVPSPEIIQNRESMLEEIMYLLREQRSVPNVVNSTINRPCAPGGPISTWILIRKSRSMNSRRRARSGRKSGDIPRGRAPGRFSGAKPGD